MNSRMHQRELRAIFSLGMIFCLRMLGIFMVLPVLSTYGFVLKGANITLIGLAIGIYGFVQAIFQIPFGLMSDYIGRKPLIIFGLLLFFFGSVIAALTDSIWGVILGRALQGAGAVSSVIIAFLSDLIREQHRTKAMAFIGILFGITFLIAIVIGPILTYAVGLHNLFWFISFLAFLGIIIVFIVPNPSDYLLNSESGIVKTSISSVFFNFRLGKLNFSIFCLHFLLASSFLVLPIQLKEVGFLASENWKIYFYTMLISFILSAVFIIYAEVKQHIKLIFILSIGILGISECMFFILGLYFWGLVIGLQLFFFAFNVLEAILPSFISKEAPVGFRGTAMGIYSTSQFFGIGVGGTFSGFILSHFGVHGVFIMNIIISVIWYFLGFFIHEPSYIKTLRIVLDDNLIIIPSLKKYLEKQVGVSSVFIDFSEKAVYLKIDSKITNLSKLQDKLSSLCSVEK